MSESKIQRVIEIADSHIQASSLDTPSKYHVRKSPIYFALHELGLDADCRGMGCRVFIGGQELELSCCAYQFLLVWSSYYEHWGVRAESITEWLERFRAPRKFFLIRQGGPVKIEAANGREK